MAVRKHGKKKSAAPLIAMLPLISTVIGAAA